jgi:hypothetical protein
MQGGNARLAGRSPRLVEIRSRPAPTRRANTASNAIHQPRIHGNSRPGLVSSAARKHPAGDLASPEAGTHAEKWIAWHADGGSPQHAIARRFGQAVAVLIRYAKNLWREIRSHVG